jgi:PPK2 family polyphosphate:nucleotide phosphotransferase
MDYYKKFLVDADEKVKLKDIDPGYTDGKVSEEDAQIELAADRKKLWDLQELLYANRQRGVLICLQGMDGAGKDGTISHVLGGMNPQGCRVAAFKQPSAEEASHDFLWRIHQRVPSKGEVVVFNRSQYEDVLVARVHKLVPKDVWKSRYDQINEFEAGLVKNSTSVLKFCLHISKEEQLKRFKARLDDPTKQWKISDADYKERPYWDDYVDAYEDALSRCSTPDAPWFIIPSNKKWFRNLAIARIIVEHMESLKLKRPKPSVDLELIRSEYHAAAAKKE